MKLINGLIPTQVGNSYVAVPAGESRAVFSGMIRNNDTAHFIYKQLMKDTTEDALVEAILGEYSIDGATARKDVRHILQQLRNAGLLDET